MPKERWTVQVAPAPDNGQRGLRRARRDVTIFHVEGSPAGLPFTEILGASQFRQVRAGFLGQPVGEKSIPLQTARAKLAGRGAAIFRRQTQTGDSLGRCNS